MQGGIYTIFLKSSFVVASLLVRSVIEEIAKRERSYNASTYELCFPEIACVFLKSLDRFLLVKLIGLSRQLLLYGLKILIIFCVRLQSAATETLNYQLLSTLNFQHSTLNLQLSTFNFQLSTRNRDINCRQSTGDPWRGEMWVGHKIKMIFLRYVAKNAYFCNLKYFVDYEEIYIDSRIALYCIHR